jgi:hypothetical protein
LKQAHALSRRWIDLAGKPCLLISRLSLQDVGSFLRRFIIGLHNLAITRARTLLRMQFVFESFAFTSAAFAVIWLLGPQKDFRKGRKELPQAVKLSLVPAYPNR